MTALKLANGVKAGCMSVVLLAASAFAAEKSPLLGLTREQLLERQGDPRSQIAAGGREVMSFARERIVLRNGVVVEVDILAPDFGARRATPPAAPVTAPAPTSDPAVATPPADLTAADVTPQLPPPAPDASSAAPVSPTPAEPQFAIKSVRPPSAGGTRPPTKTEPNPAPAPVAAAPTAANSEAKKNGAAPVAPKSAMPAASVATKAPAPVEPKTPADDRAPAPSSVSEPTVASTEPSPADPAAAAPDDAKKVKTKTASKKRAADTDLIEPEESIISGQTYLYAALIIGSGVAFLVWRSRQRQLELAASAVSRPPFSVAPMAADGGAMFPADLLANLEWKRFEELVVAYYSKTGVIAVRTKAGPDSPVHVKISWKGEARPFALVQCIAHPAGLVDATRIQELFTVLTADDIRRGYAVTTGKFNVAARDLAEEKHITLLSGDLLLEKVNALPPPVRAELLQEFSVGDYTTPSCPKCDAKMERSDEDPKIWQCKTHPDATVRAWK